MATVYFTEKVDVRSGVRWTGNNLAEVEAWAETTSPQLLPIVDNGDGTITCNTPDWTVSTNEWLTNLGHFDDSVMDNFQQVSGEPPFSWGIVGS